MLFARNRHGCRLGSIFIVAALSFGPAERALATPVAYAFSTGPLTIALKIDGTTNHALSDALSGLSVTGSFTYDSDTPLSGTTDGPTVFGQSNYAGAVSNLLGSVGSFNFTGPSGVGSVANEGYAPPVPPPLTPPPPADFFQLATFTPGGFQLSDLNLSLVDVRLFWIERIVINGVPIPDFLDDNSLPSPLPDFAGRLALDFVTPGGGFPSLNIAFFDGLNVAPVAVAEPGTLSLLSLASIGLLTVAARRRRRRVPNPMS